MGDDDGGARFHDAFECALDQALVFSVKSAGGFVEEQDGRVFQDGAGDGEALPLSAGKLHAAFAEPGFVALREGFDKLSGLGGLRCARDFQDGGVFGPVANVFGNRVGKERDILRDERDACANFIDAGFAQGDAVEQDLAA